MQFSYDPQFNVAYIRFCSKDTQVKSIPVSNDLIIDLSPDGKLFGIEFLNAREQLEIDETGKLFLSNQATGHEIEFPVTVGS